MLGNRLVVFWNGFKVFWNRFKVKSPPSLPNIENRFKVKSPPSLPNNESQEISKLVNRLRTMYNGCMKADFYIKKIQKEFVSASGTQRDTLIHKIREDIKVPMNCITDFLLQLKDYEIAREGTYLKSVKDYACSSQDKSEKIMDEKYAVIEDKNKPEIEPYQIDEAISAISEVINYEQALNGAIFDELSYGISFRGKGAGGPMNSKL